MLLSPHISPSPPLSPCPYVYSLCLFLHCCPANKFFVTIVLDFMYMHSVQSLSRVRLFAIPWTAACQASLSFTISWSLTKLISVDSVMLSKSSHSLPLSHSPTSPSAFGLSQNQGLFQGLASLNLETHGSFDQVAKVLKLQLQHQSFQ